MQKAVKFADDPSLGYNLEKPFSSKLPQDQSDVEVNGLQKEFLVRRSDIYAGNNPVKPSYKGKFHEQIK